MEASGIGALGIDGRALLFQIANFSILLLLLRLFAYKPLLAMLEARRRRIEEGLKNADQVEALKQSLHTQQQALLQEAQKQADALLKKSKEQASHLIQEAQQEASRKAEELLAQTKRRLDAEIEHTRVELKREAAQLVVAATEKVLHEKLTSEKDQDLIRTSLTVS